MYYFYLPVTVCNVSIVFLRKDSMAWKSAHQDPCSLNPKSSSASYPSSTADKSKYVIIIIIISAQFSVEWVKNRQQ